MQEKFMTLLMAKNNGDAVNAYLKLESMMGAIQEKMDELLPCVIEQLERRPDKEKRIWVTNKKSYTYSGLAIDEINAKIKAHNDLAKPMKNELNKLRKLARETSETLFDKENNVIVKPAKVTSKKSVSIRRKD